jgi:hypothetical protein
MICIGFAASLTLSSVPAGIIVDALPQLYDPSMGGDGGRGGGDLAGIDQDVARAIATSSVFGPRNTDSSSAREYDPVARVSRILYGHSR